MGRTILWTTALCGALMLGAAGAAAQTAGVTGDDLCAGAAESCTPIYACIEPDGVFARGRALGSQGGAVEATLSTGEACTGFWSRAADGTGAVYGDCEDGRSFFVGFSYLHAPSGTALGDGATDRGEEIRGWSGRNIEAYLTAEQAEIVDRLQCGATLYPVS